jgi:hypothetical protein
VGLQAIRCSCCFLFYFVLQLLVSFFVYTHWESCSCACLYAIDVGLLQDLLGHSVSLLWAFASLVIILTCNPLDQSRVNLGLGLRTTSKSLEKNSLFDSLDF